MPEIYRTRPRQFYNRCVRERIYYKGVKVEFVTTTRRWFAKYENTYSKKISRPTAETRAKIIVNIGVDSDGLCNEQNRITRIRLSSSTV